MKKVEHLIKEVYPGSIAEELEIEPGDVLLSINDQSIEDVFDYRYMIKDEYIEVLIRKPDGEEWVLEIDKDYDDDLGIEFENQLMSDYKSCSNKCIFCFRICNSFFLVSTLITGSPARRYRRTFRSRWLNCASRSG